MDTPHTDSDGEESPESLKFLVTHFDLLLYGEAHYETIEAILCSLGSATAPKECPKGTSYPNWTRKSTKLPFLLRSSKGSVRSSTRPFLSVQGKRPLWYSPC